MAEIDNSQDADESESKYYASEVAALRGTGYEVQITTTCSTRRSRRIGSWW